MARRASITGITGQDGSYLTELLLGKGYEVHGLVRRSSTFGTERIDHMYVDRHVDTASLFLHYGDLTDGDSLSRLFQEIQPHEIYNLGAQSHVAVSFENPIYSVDVDALGTLRLPEPALGELVGFEREIHWDTTKPDGQPRRMLDTTHARESFDFEAEVGLEDGMRRTIDWWETVGESLCA